MLFEEETALVFADAPSCVNVLGSLELCFSPLMIRFKKEERPLLPLLASCLTLRLTSKVVAAVGADGIGRLSSCLLLMVNNAMDLIVGNILDCTPMEPQHQHQQ